MIEEYRAYLIRSGASAQTVRHYVDVVARLQRHAGVPVEELTADHVALFLHRPDLSPQPQRLMRLPAARLTCAHADR